MNIPFSIEQFFNLFRIYNEAIGPAPFIIAGLAIVALFFLGKTGYWSSRAPGLFLVALWLWTGIVYHLVFFTKINPAARLFGIMFILQAFAFLVTVFSKTKLQFRFEKTLQSYAGMALITYALIIYPLLGYLFGHAYPSSPSFGAPCPSTIYTFGLLMLSTRAVPLWLYAIPALWAIIGFNAALSFTVYEDFGLLAAAVIAVGFRIFKGKSEQ